MAKQRFVNTRFWSDNFIVGLEAIERYLFLYFLTNEHTNICGTYELPMRTMLYETGMVEKELKKALIALTEKIVYIDGWVHVKNFERHQVARGSEKVQKGVASAKKEVPADIWEKIENYSKIKRKTNRVSNHTDSISTLDSDLDSDSDLDLDSDNYPATPVAPVKEKKKRETQPHYALIEFFFQEKGWEMDHAIAKRYLRASRDVLSACKGDLESAKAKMLKVKAWADLKVLDWSMETILKRWFELDEETSKSPKRAYIEGDPAYKRGDDWFVIVNGEHKKWVGPLNAIKYA